MTAYVLLTAYVSGPGLYEKSMEVAGYDAGKHTEEDPLITPEKYAGQYQSIGTPKVRVWPGVEKRVADDIEPDTEPDPPEQRTVVETIRAEAIKPSRGDEGRPLPLAGHWHSRSFPLTEQLALIDSGKYILPFMGWPKNNDSEVPEGFERLAEEELPFTMIYGQQLTKRFFEWDAGWEDAVLTDDGKLNPDGPTSAWKRLGRTWTDHDAMKKLQDIYPDPPLVQFVSNNERYQAIDGADYSEQNKALFEGIREGLRESAWKENSMVLGYQGIWPPWDGGMDPYYQRDWKPNRKIMNFFSVQTVQMNSVPMIEALLKNNPEQWYELIFWNGSEKKQQQYEEAGLGRTTPARYRGWIQFGMWLMTPRVARQWNNFSRDRLDENGYWPNMQEIIKAVNATHNDSVLKRFWRHGDLVPNTKYENKWAPGWLGDRWLKENRFFLLDTSEHPSGTPAGWMGWDKNTKIPVFALARKIGQGSSREWLIYAHAPMGDRQNVEIEIPEYGTVTVDSVREEGRFYHVDSSGEVTVVQASLSDKVDSSPR